MNFLQSKYENDYIRSSKLEPLIEIEKFKQCATPKICLSDKVHDILYNMRNKDDLNFAHKTRSHLMTSIVSPSFDRTHRQKLEGNLFNFSKQTAGQSAKNLAFSKDDISKSSKNILHKGYLKSLLKSVKKNARLEV